MDNDVPMPTTVAKQVLQDGHFCWLDNIYLTRANIDFNKAKQQTSAIISEVESAPDYLADDTFKGWTATVEVQLFYSPDATFSLMVAEIDVARLFINKGWQVARSDGHETDPDTRQISKTFYFRTSFYL